MNRIYSNWNHTSQEIDKVIVGQSAVTDDWLKEIAWQLARINEKLGYDKPRITRVKPVPVVHGGVQDLKTK